MTEEPPEEEEPAYFTIWYFRMQSRGEMDTFAEDMLQTLSDDEKFDAEVRKLEGK